MIRIITNLEIRIEEYKDEAYKTLERLNKGL